ncbi:MAG: MBL fold metallo-hydrolase [Acidobacteriia bacterium]|nr:MBL fold metallo-hydrolase [Terriglobia bacterium]
MPKVCLISSLAWFAYSGLLSADQGDTLLQVHFVDVGQGDAIWIQGPAGECSDNGLNIIIDGGPDTGKGNRLITYLETYKFVKDSVIDYAIITHPHDDHYPGMTDILKNYQVKTIIDSGFPADGVKFQKFLTAAKSEKVGNKPSTFIEMRKQPTYQLPDCTDLHISILFGDTDQAGLGSGNSRVNNASTVVRIEYKKFSFLFMGDLEGKDRADPADKLSMGEKALLSKVPAEKLRATVLKVGHHGSETSSTLSLIRAVQPDVIVIQSGRKAFSGTFLPDQSVIDRYKKERPGVTIVRTDEGDEQQGLDTTNDADGDDIAILTDGDSLRVRQARLSGSKRQWVTVKKLQK